MHERTRPEVKPVPFSWEFKVYMTRLARKCLIATGYGSWTLAIEWSDRERDALMEVTVMNDYERIIITVFSGMIEPWNGHIWEKMASAMMHEVCHIFAAPMQAMLRQHTAPSQSESLQSVVEVCVQRITMSLIRAMGTHWALPHMLEREITNKMCVESAYWLLPMVKPVGRDDQAYDLTWKEELLCSKNS